MATRQFAIIFTKYDDAIYREVEPLLRMLFYHIEPRPADGVLLCRTNRPEVSLYNVRIVLCDHWDNIDGVYIKVIPDDDIEDLADEYGFTTADRYL